MSDMVQQIDPAVNVAAIKARLAAAAQAAGRDADAAEIVAVSKKHDEARIRPVLEAGHRVFGENRVQEAATKWPALRVAFPDIELHLVGPLQTNKAKDAVALFDVIESVDRPKLARILGELRQEAERFPKLFVQVNTGEEEQKAGVGPREAAAFLRQCREEFGLEIAGLMCIPPAEEEPALHFALLRKIAEDNGVGLLSMGMSGDFETAAKLGATHVRVGSAIFGPRPG